MSADCPREEELACLVEGTLAETMAVRVRAHLDGCELCRTTVAELTLARSQTLTSGKGEASLAKPDRLGRWVLLEVLGAGAMGTVHGAYDPQLERKVALKVLHVSGSAEADARLLREAQAMAQVSHPNVVTVHEVFSSPQGPVVVMELVDGTTLRTWQQQPRSRAELLHAYAAAGRGLLAVHEAGLVHRDFKPSNVLVGRDGRVRIADFGLVREESARAAPLAASSGIATGTGALVGTPAYMAPEQLRGGRADARSDQFSFAVSVFEALAGRRPFEGETIGALLATIDQGPPELPGDVPLRARRAVLRALSAAPEARFPSMAPLLEELMPEPSRRSRVAVAIAAPLFLALTAGGLLATRERPCTDSARHLAGVWDAETRGKLEAAFLKTNAAYAPEAWAAFSKAVEAWSAQWLAMHQDACEATRVRGDQSEHTLELRMSCLEEERRDLRVMVGALSQATPALVARAPSFGSQLPPVASCADLELLRSQVPLPKDPALREQVIAARERVAALRESFLAGKEVLAEVKKFEPEVAKLGDSRLTIELMRLHANIVSSDEPRAAPPLNHEQLKAALTAGDLHSAAYAWTALAYGAADGFEDYAKGLEYVALAEAAVTKVPDYRISARVRDARATLLYQTGDMAGAARVFEESLPAVERDFGPESIDMSTALNNAANVVTDKQKALEYQQRAYDLRVKLVGPSHPMSCTALVNLASRLSGVGKGEEAVTRGREAVTCTEKAFGPTHQRVANALGGLSLTLRGLKRWEEALEVSRKSFDVYLKSAGPEHRQTAAARSDVAAALEALGRGPEALHELEAVVATLAKCCAETPMAARLQAEDRIAALAVTKRQRVEALQAALAEAVRLKRPEEELARRRKELK